MMSWLLDKSNNETGQGLGSRGKDRTLINYYDTTYIL